MPSAWSSPCGVEYRLYEDGRIEVKDVGFAVFASGPAGGEAKAMAKMWAKWGPSFIRASKQNAISPIHLAGLCYIESGGNERASAACEPTYCPAIWNAGGCASQGGTHVYCAGGLMAFTQGTAKIFGRTVDWYMDNPEQMIVDAGQVLTMKIKERGGDFLSGIKAYNGGKTCSSSGQGQSAGLVGMFGQGDYVSKFIKTCNSLVLWGIAKEAADSGGSSTVASGAAVAGLILGVGAFIFAETMLGFPLTNAVANLLQRAASDRSPTQRGFAGQY